MDWVQMNPHAPPGDATARNSCKDSSRATVNVVLPLSLYFNTMYTCTSLESIKSTIFYTLCFITYMNYKTYTSPS